MSDEFLFNPGQDTRANPAAVDQTVKARFVRATKETRYRQRSYWLNHAFLEGYQWLMWDPARNRLDYYPDKKRIQATFNRMRSNTRNIIGRATSRPLHFEVFPDSGDDASIRAARLGRHILDDLKIQQNWELKREQHLLTAWKGGTGALWLDWDASREVPLLQPLSIAEFVVEPGAREAERARWWITAQALNPEEVRSIFEMEATPRATATNGLGPFQAKLLSGSTAGSGSESVPLTLVLTYYERPNDDYPEGRLLIEVDDQIVQSGPWPFPFEDVLNMVIITETVQESEWYGTTVLDDARPLQVAYNAAWSNLLEHMRQGGNARLWVPALAADMMRDATDRPGEMIAAPANAQKPEWLTPPPMPAWWQQTPDQIAAELDDVMGVHEVSRGMAPPNIESGLGIQILTENDATPVGRLVRGTADAWTRLSRLSLELIQAESKNKKTVRVQTPGNAPEVMEWRGKDLLGQTDSRVPVDAIVPKSKAQSLEMAKMLVQMGLITSLPDFVAISEMPEGAQMIESVNPDVALARYENSIFATGDDLLAPNSWENHALHITEHNRFRKTARYRNMTVELKNDFALHIQGHETLAAEEIGKQRLASSVDPALGEAPNVNEAPPVAPLEPPGEPPMPPQQEPAPPPGEMMGLSESPEDFGNAALAALEAGGTF